MRRNKENKITKSVTKHKLHRRRLARPRKYGDIKWRLSRFVSLTHEEDNAEKISDYLLSVVYPLG
jgi:hypothetical protein